MPLSFNLEEKAFSFTHARTKLAWKAGLVANGQALTSAQADCQIVQDAPLRLCLHFPQIGLSWELSIDESADALVIHSTLQNHSSCAIALGKITLLDASEPVRLGETQDIVCLSLPGELFPRNVYPLAHADCPRASKIKVQFLERATQTALQVGFLTFQRANTEVEHSYDPQLGIASLRAWCDFAGWELPPGAATAAETFILAVGDSPYRQLEQWADLAAAYCHPRRWEDAPIGWIGWAWVDAFTVERYEDVLLRNCAAIRQRLPGFGVNYVWLSLGNLGGTNPGDWLSWNEELFPNGPAYLAARLKELGFRWGLWCAPFWLCSALREQVEEYRDALLKNPDGSLMVVRKEWQFGPAGWMPKQDRPCIYAFDPSHPRFLDFIRKAFEGYRRWGVRYYMLDFLQAGAGNIASYPYAAHHDQRLVAGPETYHHALRVIREAAGDDTYFLSSTGPSVHNAGIVDAIRTGSDFGEGRALYPDAYFYPATFVINSGAFWTGPLWALKNQAAAYYTHRKLYLNDSGNVLTVDKPLPLSDAQVHATIHALSGAGSMLGDDIEQIEEERLALIKKTLPRPKAVAFPVDLFDAAFPDYPKVFHRHIAKPWGEFEVVAVYNFGEELLRERIPLTKLGWAEEDRALIWEFWNAEYIGQAQGHLLAAVPPRSVRVYRLTRTTGQPTLLGTDMHLTMGEMEIDRCQWDAAARTLSGRAIRPAGERGNVFIHAPAGLRVVNPRGYYIAKDARDSSLIIRAPLRFADGSASWSVTFADVVKALDLSKVEA